MQVEIELARGEKVRCEAIIQPGMVMCGGDWWPGVEVVGPVNDFALETVAYAINEGGVLFDTWEHEPDDDANLMVAFKVVEGSSVEFEKLRRLNAKPPVGAIIKTEDGYRLTVTETGIITDGDMEFTSLQEVADAVEFVMLVE